MSSLTVSSSPHIRQKTSTPRIMADVIIALMPALIASVIIFGYRAVVVTGVCVAGCVLAEFIWQKLMHQKVTGFRVRVRFFDDITFADLNRRKFIFFLFHLLICSLHKLRVSVHLYAYHDHILYIF